MGLVGIFPGARLAANLRRSPQVAFFCTFGGRGDQRALAQMQELAGKTPRATAAFKQHDVLASSYSAALDRFVDALTR